MADGGDFRLVFHKKLDRDYDEKKQQLEERLKDLEAQREKAHEWINSAPEPVLRAIANGTEALAGDDAPLAIREPRRVTLYEPIKTIITSIDPQHEITSAIVYDALLQAVPALQYENEWKLKARIAATLGRFVDEKLLKVSKTGRGSAPHVYVLRNPPYASVMEGISRGRAKKK